MVDDAEGEVEIGEAVAAPVDRERPHGGSRDDTLVFFGEPKHALAECISLLDSEHGPVDRGPAEAGPRAVISYGCAAMKELMKF